MKRLLCIFALILTLALAGSAGANPMLTCDCSQASDGITSAQVLIDSGSWVTAPVVGTCGSGVDKVVCTSPSVTVCYDLASLAAGSHTAKGHWSNSQGRVSADSVPLSFPILGIPSSPTNQKLVVQ